MIRNAYSAGRLDISVSSSSANAGGITGYQSGTSAVTEYCYSTMDVSGYYAGGIVGYHYGGSVNNCVALSETVSGRQFVNSYVGRVAARESAGAVKADNYAWTDMADSDGNVISTLLAGELTNKNGEDISSAEAADEKFWADLGFDSSIWKIETGSLPVLAGSDAEGVLPEHLRGDSAVELGGNGTVEAPYQISTTDDLVFAMQQINSDESYRSACFVLTADIDLSGISWQAIGTAGAPFTGTFDGGNHRISNLNLVVNAEYQGFFGVTEDAYIHNMIVQGSVTGNDYAGGIVGYASGDTVIEACQSKVDVTAYPGTAAGVAGVNEGTIRHCIQTGDIQGPEAAAGIAGRNEGTIEHCYSIGTLTAQNTGAGGIAVENSGTIRCCAAMEEFITVTEPGTIGRIAVSNTGTLESNYVWSEMELTGTVTDDEILNGKESAVTLISKNRELFPEDMWTLREGFYPMLIGQTDMNYILPHQVSDGRELIGTINIIIPEPEAGKAPVTELAGDGWSAVVEWSPAVNGTFAYDTAYTAVITVTLEDGYVLDDAAVFYVNGIETAFAGNDPYTITVEFEKTGAKPADPAAGAEGGDASGTGAAVKTGVNDFVMQMVLLVLISGAAVIAAIRIRKNRL